MTLEKAEKEENRFIDTTGTHKKSDKNRKWIGEGIEIIHRANSP